MKFLKGNPDFLIIGGGIFGCAIAWNLSRRSSGSVLLFERQGLASATTPRAAGLIRNLNLKQGQTALKNYTIEAIGLLSEELEEPLHWHQVGGLLVAESEANIKHLENLERHALNLGENFCWIGRTDVEDLVPWVDASKANKCALLPDDGFIDPYLLATFFAKAAKKHGAVLKTDIEVTALQKSGNRITGVQTPQGEISAGCVIDAAGPWAGLVALEIGWHLPMAPIRSHYWITSKAPEFKKAQPYVIFPDANAYARTEMGGLLFGIRDRISLSYDPRELPSDLTELRFNEDPDGWNVLEEQGSELARFYPGLESTPIAHYIAGPSTYTPDGQFVLGSVPDVDGFLVATGCCGAGIGASGGVGSAIADLAIEGQTRFDLEGFRTDRFGRIDAFSSEWMKRCANARSKKG
ncbi:FAD-binding oxidoreductase [Deltaproteobacteria bacterium]|nr:FAD-binding oxidoreductase [Deltaproteobacteria bacterium]